MMMYLLLVSCLLMAADESPPPTMVQATVGMTGTLSSLTLPGSELEAKPYDDRKIPIFLRVRSARQIGTSYQYDLEFQGYDPGTYDLREYLRRKDGSSMNGVPAIHVKVVPIRGPGQVEPNTLQIDSSFGMGGYRWWLLGGGLLWLGGLFFIIYYGFWPKPREKLAALAAPLTLADRLRPLVEQAMAGQAKPEELASLERCLLAWWRRKLGMPVTQLSESNTKLRQHAEAGPLLQQLELWLHRPGTREQVDVAQLLEPYRSVVANDLDVVEARA